MPTRGAASGGCLGLAPIAVCFVLATALVACSSPRPVLYTIAPVAGQTLTGAPKVIALREISLARYLQQLQIVRSSAGYRLDVMNNDWWGEPLSALMGRVLVDELRQRLPESTVVSDSGAVSVPSDATVEINIERLDEDAGGSLVLQAQASVDFKRRSAPRLRTFRFVVPTSSPDIAAEVASISSALGQLADGLASMLTAEPAPR
jgi:uncharacterized protein